MFLSDKLKSILTVFDMNVYQMIKSAITYNFKCTFLAF